MNMENSHKVTAEFLKQNPRNCKPHVVILGAGASIQAFPNGDRNGLRLPVMDNLLNVIEISNEISNIDLSENFEKIYSKLFSNQDSKTNLKIIEDKIHNYFSKMRLPECPTLYDHLLLSLRNNDLVVTFNWDPLLFDAWERLTYRISSEYLPSIAFLHGNVRLGYCLKDKIFGRNGRFCSECDVELQPTPLLFPIENKNYEENPMIRDAWQRFHYGLENAFTVTIFGYSAPSSDIVAIDTMKDAWKNKGDKEFETFFIIDIKGKETIRNTWKSFIFSHHYRIERDFYKSLIPRYSRRNTEAQIARTLEGRFVEACPIPKDADWEELMEWYNKMNKYENE